MRWVYLHVAFTWAGISLISLVGLGAVYLIFKPTAIQESLWVAPAQTAGLILFGVGFVLSLAASWTSWGGILWMEPRVLSSIGILGGGFAAVIVVSLMVNPRTIGVMALLMWIALNVALASTGRIFHPEDPIGESGSMVIRLTFYSLTLVALAIGVVLAMILRGSPGRPGNRG